MTNSLIACPLCCHPNFSSVDMLRICLLRVTNRPLACPICCEDQMGLDKFTIHLLSHTMEKLQRTEEPLPYYRPNDSVREQSHDVTNGIHSQDPMTDIASNNSSHDQQSPLEIRNDYAERTCDEIPCYTCGSQFRSSELQHIHQQLVHEHQPNQLPRTPSPTVKSTKTSFQCTFCAKRFKMKGSLRLHSRMVHGRIAGGQSLLADDLKKSPRSETECPSSRNAGFVEGEAAVADEKPFPCDVCGKSFTTKYFLRKHKRLHTGEMPYVCEVCSRTFTFQQSYHRHLSYHTDERPHVCPVCGRAFKELSTLHNHERIHSGEKPFKCDICGIFDSVSWFRFIHVHLSMHCREIFPATSLLFGPPKNSCKFFFALVVRSIEPNHSGPSFRRETCRTSASTAGTNSVTKYRCERINAPDCRHTRLRTIKRCHPKPLLM